MKRGGAVDGLVARNRAHFDAEQRCDDTADDEDGQHQDQAGYETG